MFIFQWWYNSYVSAVKSAYNIEAASNVKELLPLTPEFPACFGEFDVSCHSANNGWYNTPCGPADGWL